MCTKTYYFNLLFWGCSLLFSCKKEDCKSYEQSRQNLIGTWKSGSETRTFFDGKEQPGTEVIDQTITLLADGNGSSKDEFGKIAGFTWTYALHPEEVLFLRYEIAQDILGKQTRHFRVELNTSDKHVWEERAPVFLRDKIDWGEFVSKWTLQK
jgi:hypothetical protein